MIGDREYLRTLRELLGRRRAGVDLSLGRVTAVVETLSVDAPRCSVQIAGTNGKGSTCAFLEAMCREAGYRVGVFSSPHLLSICERFRVEGAPVSPATFVEAASAVDDADGQELTFFEKLTAMAVWIFAMQKVDVAIYEVGLGGRLDSTSALRHDLAAITGIGLDHCEYLGSSLEKIADEKAAVFHAGAPAIVGLSADDAIRRRLLASAERVGARPIAVGTEHLARLPETVALVGAHQRRNGACAIACADALGELGLALSNEAVDQGLRHASIAGRFEEVEGGLWVDGAHNPQGAQSLAALIAERAPWVLVVGFSKGKDVDGILQALVPCAALVVASTAGQDRSMAPEHIAERARALGAAEVLVATSSAEALSVAREWAAGQPILATGSLLFIGAVLASLGRGPVDPVDLSDPVGLEVARSKEQA